MCAIWAYRIIYWLNIERNGHEEHRSQAYSRMSARRFEIDFRCFEPISKPKINTKHVDNLFEMYYLLSRFLSVFFSLYLWHPSAQLALTDFEPRMINYLSRNNHNVHRPVSKSNAADMWNKRNDDGKFLFSYCTKSNNRISLHRFWFRFVTFASCCCWQPTKEKHFSFPYLINTLASCFFQ